MKIYKENDKWRITSQLEVHNKLHSQNYLVGKDDIGFHLTEYPDYSFLKDYEVLGATKTDKYLTTFNRLKKPMGVWFTGLKGSGKTLHAKLLCYYSKLPVLTVTQPFIGSEFNAFLASIKQPIILFIDEFEKVYKDIELQEQLLTLFDGNLSAQILFLLTSNTKEVSPFLQNRTGRIRYLENFGGVDEETVIEVVEKKLENQELAQELISVVNILSTVSMDNLLTIIEEMNLYGYTVKEALQGLNIQFEHTEFDLLAYIDGIRIQRRIYYNPFIASQISFSYEVEDKRNNRTLYHYYSKPTNELKLSINDRELTYTDNNGNELTFIPTTTDVTNLLNYI